MSAKKPATVTLIKNQITLYQRSGSPQWQCCIKVGDKWLRKTTGQDDLELAKIRAVELRAEAKVRKESNLPLISKKFKDIANLVKKRFEDEIKKGNNKKTNNENIALIENYLLPFFGKYNIGSITTEVIEEFKVWREDLMKKAPSRSTEQNHYTVLNKIFDHAISRGYLSTVDKPQFKPSGEKSKPRPDFDLLEIVKLKENFNRWISLARADHVEKRKLLRDYVEVLFDTGMRPGKEIESITWTMLTINDTANVVNSGEIHTDEYGEETEIFKSNFKRAIFIDLKDTKTKKPRKCVGKWQTYQALNRIAERNHGKTLREMIESKSKGKVFEYREYFPEDNNSINISQKKLLKPVDIGKLFKAYLEFSGILKHPVTDEDRVLYSLRHTYATFSILHDKVDVHILSRQMGTSMKMIDDYYSSVNAIKSIDFLRGEETAKALRKIRDFNPENLG